MVVRPRERGRVELDGDHRVVVRHPEELLDDRAAYAAAPSRRSSDLSNIW